MIGEFAVDFEMSQEELEEFIMNIPAILERLEQEYRNLNNSIS